MYKFIKGHKHLQSKLVSTLKNNTNASSTNSTLHHHSQDRNKRESNTNASIRALKGSTSKRSRKSQRSKHATLSYVAYVSSKAQSPQHSSTHLIHNTDQDYKNVMTSQYTKCTDGSRMCLSGKGLASTGSKVRADATNPTIESSNVRADTMDATDLIVESSNVGADTMDANDLTEESIKVKADALDATDLTTESRYTHNYTTDINNTDRELPIIQKKADRDWITTNDQLTAEISTENKQIHSPAKSEHDITTCTSTSSNLLLSSSLSIVSSSSGRANYEELSRCQSASKNHTNVGMNALSRVDDLDLTLRSNRVLQDESTIFHELMNRVEREINKEPLSSEQAMHEVEQNRTPLDTKNPNFVLKASVTNLVDPLEAPAESSMSKQDTTIQEDLPIPQFINLESHVTANKAIDELIQFNSARHPYGASMCNNQHIIIDKQYLAINNREMVLGDTKWNRRDRELAIRPLSSMAETQTLCQKSHMALSYYQNEQTLQHVEESTEQDGANSVAMCPKHDANMVNSELIYANKAEIYNHERTQSSSNIQQDGKSDTTHVASYVVSLPKQLVNTTIREYGENSSDNLQIDIDDTYQPIMDSSRSYEMVNVTNDAAVKLSTAITDTSKPKARKKGKRQQHKLTKAAKRRVRPVKRKELNRPCLLLKIHLAKDSEPTVIDKSDSSLGSGQHYPSHVSASINNTQHQRKSKKKEKGTLLGRGSIFCASVPPETHVSVTDAASPKQQKRGKKRKSVQGNISYMLTL
jgi:hypothetical protein